MQASSAYVLPKTTGRTSIISAAVWPRVWLSRRDGGSGTGMATLENAGRARKSLGAVADDKHRHGRGSAGA
jgi:hypothetical protein